MSTPNVNEFDPWLIKQIIQGMAQAGLTGCEMVSFRVLKKREEEAYFTTEIALTRRGTTVRWQISNAVIQNAHVDTLERTGVAIAQRLQDLESGSKHIPHSNNILGQEVA